MSRSGSGFPERPPLTGGFRPEKSVGTAKRRWIIGLSIVTWVAPLLVWLGLQFPVPAGGLARFVWQLPLVYAPAFAVALLAPHWLVVSFTGRVLLLVAAYRGLHGRERAQISFAAIIFLDRLTQLWASSQISEAPVIPNFSPGFGSLYLWLVILVGIAVLLATVYFVIIRE